MSRIPDFAKIAFEKTAAPTPAGRAAPWLTPEGIPVKSTYTEADLVGIEKQGHALRFGPGYRQLGAIRLDDLPRDALQRLEDSFTGRGNGRYRRRTEQVEPTI